MVFSPEVGRKVRWGGGLVLLPVRQVDDDGDELAQHGVFSRLMGCFWGSGCSFPGKVFGNSQGGGSGRCGSECRGGGSKGGGGFLFPVDQHVGLLGRVLVE